MKFFIADTHFFHEQLLGLSDFAPRPFQTIEEMNEKIIESWNAVVEEKDTVYHLGDIAMHPDYDRGNPEVFQLLKRLTGKIVFIKGNHDTSKLFSYLKQQDMEEKFEFHEVGARIKFNHHQYFMTHSPLLLGQSVNSRNLHGHIHHYSMPLGDTINVGVDAPERDLLSRKIPFGTPLSENQIDEIGSEKIKQLEKLQ